MTEKQEIFLELAEQFSVDKTFYDEAFTEFLHDRIDDYEWGYSIFNEDEEDLKGCNHLVNAILEEEIFGGTNLRTLVNIFEEVARVDIDNNYASHLAFDRGTRTYDLKVVSKSYAEEYKEGVLWNRVLESLDVNSAWLKEYIDKELLFGETSEEELLSEEGSDVFETEKFYIVLEN